MNRLRRAILFMPGDDRRKIEKGIAAAPDSILMDLEDAVALNRKAEARAATASALSELDFSRSEKLVRINQIDSGLAEDDLAAILPARPDGIVIPKVESPEQIEWARRRLPDDMLLFVMIETARAAVNLKEIAATPDLSGLAFGAEDFVVSVGGVRTRGGRETFHARSAIALHAAAFNLASIDMVFTDLRDEAEPDLRAETRAAVELGYNGKFAIHPKQIAPIVEAFMPSPEEAARARRLVAAYDEQQAKGFGAFTFEDKMVDMPMLRAAQSVLARARG